MASQRVPLRSGCDQYGVAKDYLFIAGRWQDHHLYQRILHDRPAPHQAKWLHHDDGAR